MQNHQASKNLNFKNLLADFFTLYNPGRIAKYDLVMKQLLKQYAWILSISSAIILLLLLLNSCNQPLPTLHENITQDETAERSTQSNTALEPNGVPNFSGIANALGCVFAPQSCKSK